MSVLMKDKYYNDATLRKLALAINKVYPSFPMDNFVSDVMDETWDELELKARMRQITVHLGAYLPNKYEEALSIIDEVIAGFPAGLNDYAFIYFPDFVELYGQDEDNWDVSMAALESYTISSTAELAVRPFMIKHEARMMAQMAVWAKHDNEHVRRLASEGCRPALPWGQALPSFKKDPSPILVILEQLNADPSLYVRKSVANNLNDIAKTHPKLIANIAREWYGKHPYTDWIVKHGCRTLLKKGNKDVLAIFGFGDASSVQIENFRLSTSAISIGESFNFSFSISGKAMIRLRLEYGIDYVKANGKRSRKIFQISEISLKENQVMHYTKTHAFANLSTRQHYPGMHTITLIVNGSEREALDFEVLK